MVARRRVDRPFGEQTIGFYVNFCIRFLIGLSLALVVLSALVGALFVVGMGLLVAIGAGMGG